MRHSDRRGPRAIDDKDGDPTPPPVLRRIRASSGTKTKTPRPKPARNDPAALQNQLRLGTEEERAELQHPGSAGKPMPQPQRVAAPP